MRTCLVVDNSPVVRRVARRLFETMQFEISEAETAQEALEKCQLAMPDAILVDSQVPKTNNGELLPALRALPNGRKAIIIYTTTENDQHEIARALSAGADDYLLKPFDREGIRAKLTAAGMKA